MKKDDNKNAFLITWVSCIVFLLMLCFFGINSAVKDTYAATTYSCDSGYTLVGTKYCCPSTRTYVSGRCVTSTEASNGYCTKTVTANSRAEISSACGSGWTNTSATSLLGGTFSVNCKSTSLSVCGSAPKNATASSSTTYACYKTSAGHVWVSTDNAVASANPKVSGINSESSCNALNNSSGGNNQSGGNNTSSSCSYDIWSHSYKDKNGNSCSITTSTCPVGYYDTKPSNATGCDVKILDDGNACFNCTVEENIEVFCGEGTHVGYDEAGNKVCLPDCECADGEDCTEEEIKEESFCWNCSGKYYWGLETQYPNCSLTYKSKNNCTGSGSKPVSPSSKPSSSVPSSSVPSSSVPSSSKPSSSNSNVTENPPTGQIAIFIIWVVGLATMVYSVWYFRNIRKEN